MARANRFTTITPGNYNPMSLQELMLAPSYKRSEHDKLLESAAVLDTELAKVNPLAVHNDAARQEQERLYNNIQEQVELLNNEGFNPSSKSAFLKLHKDYQQSISPTGRLGRINAAKEALEANKAAYLESQSQQGGSMEAALQNWMDFERDYVNRFVETGEVVPIGQKFAPKYYDYLSEFQKLAAAAGVTGTDILRGDGDIVQDQLGNYVVNTETRQGGTSNREQLEALANWMNNLVNNPNSDAYKSIIHERKSPESVLNELAGMQDIFTKETTIDHSKKSYGSFTARKDNSDRKGDIFISDILQGTEMGVLAEDSPLNNVNEFSKMEFDTDGNLIQGSSEFETFEDKLQYYRDNQYNVHQDRNGTWKYVDKHSPHGRTHEITFEPHHLKGKLNQIRQDNPQLRFITDEELVTRLTKFDTLINSNYVESLTLPGVTYEGMNDRLFGNRKGGDEDSTGVFLDKAATIDGEQKDAKVVVRELGYKNFKQFKEEGHPSVEGYIPYMGKWRVTVNDSRGRARNIFVEDIPQLNNATEISRRAAEEAFKGKGFSEIINNGDGTSLYFVNDFLNQPLIISGKSGATNANNIKEQGAVYNMADVTIMEKTALINNPLFRQVLELDKK